MEKLWLLLLLTLAAATSCSQPRAASADVAPAPVFLSENPRSIYAADPHDPWNRIFHALFTRTVYVRMSDDFPEGAPFSSPRVFRMGQLTLRLSKNTSSRIELGDRAIEPLYPTFFTAEGPLQVLTEPRFSELTAALRRAIDEKRERSPVERALMQADVWAAYDILHESPAGTSARKPTLFKLLREFIRKLALSPDQIKSLKNNYALATGRNKLPDLFSTNEGWLEIELLPRRAHEDASSYRRAARVFVKPRTPPSDPAQFVESLKYNQHHDQVEAVALVVQNLLIDTSGRVVPSPLFSEVQFRFFKNDPNTRAVSAEPQQFELSRRRLLTDPASGGLVEFSARSPAYLSAAGNDYDFASLIDEAGGPVVVPLRTRCTQCHNPPLTTLMTYSIHYFPPVPAVRFSNRRSMSVRFMLRGAKRSVQTSSPCLREV